MKTYALRVIAADLTKLIANAQLLGVVAIDADGNPYEKNGGCWDYIGHKRVGDPPAEGEPDTRSWAQDANGNKYIHINARTPVDIGAVAAALATQYPDIAAGLSELNKFFVVDADGETTWPAYPARGFL